MRWGAWVFAVGGALCVLKVVFIALNDAMGRDTDSLAVPVLSLSAILFVVVGATAVGIAVFRRFPLWAQLLGALAAIVAPWVLYAVVDGILKPTFEGVGPSWLHEELVILATGAICVAVGVFSRSEQSASAGLRWRNRGATRRPCPGAPNPPCAAPKTRAGDAN